MISTIDWIWEQGTEGRPSSEIGDGSVASLGGEIADKAFEGKGEGGRFVGRRWFDEGRGGVKGEVEGIIRGNEVARSFWTVWMRRMDQAKRKGRT